MKVVDLFIRAVTTDLDRAEKKLDDTAKAADKADNKVKTLASAFKEFAGVGGPVGDLANKLQDVEDRAGSAASGFRTLAAGVGSVGAAAVLILPALVAVIGSAGVLAALRFQSTLDELSKMAEQFGYNASQADLLNSKLQGKGGLAAYEGDIQRVVRALGRADEEGKRASAAFEALGITAKEASDPQQVLLQIVEEYGQKVKDRNISLAEEQALQQALGNSWKETIFRQQEAAAALQMYNEFSERGIGISKDGEAATAAYNDAMDGLGFIFKVVGSQLVSIVLPAFTGLINAFVDSYKNGGLVKVAFEGIKVAANVLMVPLRALFNIFIQVDAAIQSVGKSIGALLAAIATRSIDPFKMLKEDISAIWATANTRTVGMWGSDTGAVDTTPAGSRGRTGGSLVTGKPKNDPIPKGPTKEQRSIFDDGDPVANELKRRMDAWRKKEDEALDALEEAERKAKQSRLDQLTSGTEIKKTEKMLSDIVFLNQAFEDGIISGDLYAQSIQKITGASAQAGESFNILERAGETAFKGLEDSLVALATGGKFSFTSFIQSMLADLARLIIQLKVVKPLIEMLAGQSGSGGALGFIGGIAKGLLSANGNAFGSTGVLKSAKGNVFDSPTLHGYKGGIGMLGEAGPEAILPLKRNSSGQLGVMMSGGGGGMQQINHITVNVEGGNTNAETGAAVSQEILKTMRGIARQEISNSRRVGGIANPI